MKKIIVSQDKCIGCGACEGLEPTVFELDDTGFAKVKENDYNKLTDEVQESVNDAVASCPTNAICVKEADEKSSNDEDTTETLA